MAKLQVILITIALWFGGISIFIPFSTLRNAPPLIWAPIAAIHVLAAIGLFYRYPWSRWLSATLLTIHSGGLVWLSITLLKAGVRGFPFGQIAIAFVVFIFMGILSLFNDAASEYFRHERDIKI